MDVTYETVIGRVEIDLGIVDSLNRSLRGERILLTGAGGSIGSKIAIALSKIPGASLVATDRDENALHSLSLQIMGTALFNSSEYRLLDVRDEAGVNTLVNQYQPTMIIHAAALKHLAILEQQPREAYLTNVLGTNNLLNAAMKFGVVKFLNISTDKAANPSSILGKSKHLAEMLTSNCRRNGFERFTNVRFGNVFNSKGSVIETFTSQIKLGLPVTLTDPDVRRYFMKIEEATNLSLMASALNEGDVHILNMGQQVKLLDIVDRLMVILEGNSPILIVGLRKGEKLSEDLYSDNEKVIDTSHPNIKAVNLHIKGNSDFPSIKSSNSDIEAIRALDSYIEDFSA
jgi:FlaA1/EpsC-like NDP-sugar epimerase